MIVRCTNCNSAFAVDDEKVANKKFAFTCPKCGTDNIYDNRKSAKAESIAESFLEEKESPASKKTDAFDESFFEDEFTAPDKKQDIPDDEIFAEERDFSTDKAEEAIFDDSSELKTEEEIFESMGEDTPESKKLPEDEDIFNDDLTINEGDFTDEEGLILDEEPKAKSERDIKISSQDDIDALFADMEEDIEKPKSKKSPDFDDDITVDIDSLDIDLEEDIPAEDLTVKSAKTPIKTKEIDEDIFIEEMPSRPQKKVEPDDDITLDLDSLDLDLEEEMPHQKEPAGKGKLPEEDLFDEELTLSVDEMDVDIDHFTEPEELKQEQVKKSPRKGVKIEESDEDESITIDLDSLDIDVEESSDVLKGELTEEEEKLTLEDAGLTFSELDEAKTHPEEELTEDELNLSIDEIDPDLKLEVLADKIDDVPLIKEIDELPEIDLEEYEATIKEEKLPQRQKAESESTMESLDDFMLSDEEYTHPTSSLDILEYDEEDSRAYMPEKGSTSFSIDYSLKYSRVGAFLRLILIYLISMIPHFIVMFVYTMASLILGFINQIVILTTGHCVEDFSLFTENTLRYFLYIKTNIIGIVEDRPVYAGREKLNHQLQLDITYPVKYSKFMAALRLSIAGIIIALLPHIIAMLLLTITVPFVYLAGIVMVIITRRWPNPLFVYLTRYFRYLARISSFAIGLTDEYPTFKFD